MCHIIYKMRNKNYLYFSKIEGAFELFMKKNKKPIIQLIIAIIGVFAALLGIIEFNQYFLMDIPIYGRMVVLIVMQWLLFLVPGILMLIGKEKMCDLGFTAKNILRQILIGVGIALIMSAIFTVIPILLGFKYMVGSTNYTQMWQFAYQFVYSVFGVALAEELVFRGYIFNKLLELRNNRWFAIITSSVIFDTVHIFSGNIIQIFVTAIIGFLFCMLREKIKNCTLLSLIVLHGVYDALIVLWCGIL